VSFPETPLLAVLPGTGGLTRLVDKRKVRRDRADVFCTTAEGIKGKRAKDWGLVDDVVARGELDARVEYWLEQILAGGPSAVNEAKRIVRDVAGRPVAEVRELTVERIAAMRVSEDGQEGMRAFLERRKARWPR
jgi:benzoyl-CoA-dihydrodiol lyase